MLLYPDVQSAAQAEIDRVIGHDRLPGYEDKELLPYVTAIMKETLRLETMLNLCNETDHKLQVAPGDASW